MIWTVAGVGCDEIVRANPRGRSYSRWHHIAIIVSDYNRSKDFYVNKLGFSVIRENYRPERNDWKSDLQCGNIELEIFGVSNPPARVSHPEAAKM